MIWTPRDEDTIGQCRRAMENSQKYHTSAAPWFGLCLRMYQTLEDHGVLKRTEVSQVVCRECIWETAGGCRQHFEGAHMDVLTGEVRFCPRKTTHDMRESQLKRYKERWKK